jgi:hypothetical protein
MAKLVFLGRLADLAGQAEREVEPGALAVILAGLPAGLAVALLDDKVRIRAASWLHLATRLPFSPPSAEAEPCSTFAC